MPSPTRHTALGGGPGFAHARTRPPRSTRGGLGGQVDRVVHDIVVGTSLGGDPRDAGRVGGGTERGERDADGERRASRDEDLP